MLTTHFLSAVSSLLLMVSWSQCANAISGELTALNWAMLAKQQEGSESKRQYIVYLTLCVPRDSKVAKDLSNVKFAAHHSFTQKKGFRTSKSTLPLEGENTFTSTLIKTMSYERSCYAIKLTQNSELHERKVYYTVSLKQGADTEYISKSGYIYDASNFRKPTGASDVPEDSKEIVQPNKGFYASLRGLSQSMRGGRSGRGTKPASGPSDAAQDDGDGAGQSMASRSGAQSSKSGPTEGYGDDAETQRAGPSKSSGGAGPSGGMKKKKAAFTKNFDGQTTETLV